MDCLNNTININNSTYSCSKKGICCKCNEYYRSLRQLPSCYILADVKNTFDRSIENFLKLLQLGGI